MKEKTKFILGCVLRIGVTLAIICMVVFKYNDLVNIDVRQLIDSAGSTFAAALAVLGVYGLKSVVFVIPASMIYLSVGIAFDFWSALLINAVGIFLEINITYFLGRFLGGEKVEQKLANVKIGEKILQLRDKKTWGIFVVRFLPACPIDFVSLFLGAAKMKYPKYILVSFFGILPRVALLSIFGTEIYEIFSKDLLMTLILVAVVGGLIFATVKYIMKYKKAK